MVELIGKFGIGLNPPSYHEIREKYLKMEVNKIDEMLQEFKDKWKRLGSDKVFEMLDEMVEKVGEENVVQVVTDNAANYKAAGQRLME
ncbi:hypothetical protein G2W53_004260 [Senna tora]|uniref:DUF659 domain-containing protein n=1 Tax=Senna tora TaxID=362788 RepID=A0A834XC08_9FABA|nr:hypothetical protein G2W53_004260 [Senna tora]